jgi:fatty-acyl-CoA synthase
MTAAPPRAQTLGDLVDELAERAGDRGGVTFRGDLSTWSQVAQRARRLASGLVRLGLRPGDRVAVLMENRLEWILFDFAIAKAGGICMGLNTWYQAEDLRYVLAHSGARAVVCADTTAGRRYIDLVQRVRAECPELEHVIVLSDAGTQYPGCTDVAQLESSGDLSGPLPAVGADAPANILYTSGTTALPKGVVLHHGKLIENGYAIGERQHLRADDILWAAIPMFFSFFSANALLATTTHFGSIVVQERFDAAQGLDLIERSRCTIYYGMPNMTQALIEEQGRRARDVSSLRTGLTIGSAEMMRLTANLVPGICNLYGLTETYGNCAVCDSDEPLELRMTTQGKLLPNFTAKVIDPETAEPLVPGTPGQLCVKGNVTSGYFRAPDLTAAAFDADGYFLTGDLGSIDADGRVHYLGRMKELIKTGGINVSPLQIEGALLLHPSVRQAHAVGVPDAAKDEIPVAFVEIDPDRPVSVDDLVRHCRGLLPAYAVPREIRLISEADLPRTASGKVQKRELVERVVKERRAGGK